jgi:hypothetical protein
MALSRPSARLAALGLLLAAGCSNPTSSAEAAVLLDQDKLPEWIVAGKATFSWEEDHLWGREAGARNSFLVSPRDYADFVLECEVRIEAGGNSGIQVRSRLREDEAVIGYQIEIDPTERAWSGGLYDEGRRGWLDPLDDQPEARAAFRVGEWNTYRIECRGDRIRSWVNGVACADFRDDQDASGRIAFQVHGGQDTQVRWRALRITELTPAG